MRTAIKWQMALVVMALMAFLMPSAWALDVCDPFLVLVDTGPVDINCETGDIFLSNAEINLLSNAHISTTLGSGSIFVDFGTTNTINIYGGQIDAMLNTASTDTVTVYGQSFDEIPGIYVPGQEQIINSGGGTLIFNLVGTYQDDSECNLPIYLETGGVINLNVQTTAPEIVVYPALSPYNVGDVEVGQTLTDPVLVQIFNHGNADLTVTSVSISGDSSFNIAPINPEIIFPLVIEPSFDIGVDFALTFAPLAEGTHTATVTIATEEEDDVVIVFNGQGVILEIPPSQQIQDILNFLDDSTAIGTIQGYGPGNSASKRLKALRNMIESASDLINAGDYAQAIEQLESIAKKTDGVLKPQDFVVGGDVPELNGMINDLIADLGS